MINYAKVVDIFRDSEWIKLKKIILKSGLFDEDYYIKNYRNARISLLSPIDYYCKYGINEDHNPNETFDVIWYKNYYEDINLNGIYPLKHFILHGKKENRFINENEEKEYNSLKYTKEFNENFYKNNYNDLKKKEDNFDFLLHYIRFGKQENRKVMYKEYSDTELHNKFIKENNSAVALHIYYFDQLKLFLDLITDLNDVALYISCPYKLNKKIKKILNDMNMQAIVYSCDNIGMDVLPFVKIYSKYIYGNYKYVCKLHTKNKKSELRSLQGDLLVNSLIGKSSLVENIIKTFNDDSSIGMAYNDLMTRSADYLMYANRENIDYMFNLLNINNLEKDWSFVAGTMFWARVDSIDILHLQKEKILGLFYQKTEDIRTGMDGTYAHSIERLLALFPIVNGYEKKILLYPTDDTNNTFSLRVDNDNVIANENFRKLGVTQTIDYYRQAIKSFKNVKKSKFFDSQYYRSNCKFYSNYEMNDILHYLIYGVDISSNPNALFSTQFYNLYHADIKRQNIHPWLHYIIHGVKENREILGDENNWELIAIREDYFNVDFYEKQYSYDKENFSAWSHYITIGYKNKNSINYNTPMKEDFLEFDSFINLLNSKYLYEKSEREVIIRNFQNEDFHGVISLIENYESKYNVSQFTKALKMSAYLRIGEYKKADIFGKLYWDQSQKNVLKKGSSLPLTKNNISGNDFFVECLEKSDIKKKSKICVYTSLFGGFSNLVDPFYKPDNVDFICFTDSNIKSKHWEIRKVKSVYGNHNLDAKHYKIFPWKYLEEYDYTLFIDANTVILGDINILINNYLLSEDFVMWKHPERSDLYDEAEVILQILRHSPTQIIEQVKAYRDDGLDRFTGLAEGSFIWRSNTDDKLKSFMSDWWKEIQKHSKRDQLSLIYLMWKNNYRPKTLPESLGNARENVLFFKADHKVKHINSDSDVLQSKTSTNNENKDIIFVYDDEFKNTGSTVMRGEQLSGYIKDSSLSKNRNISYEVMGNFRNKILFLTKGVLKKISLDKLAALKKSDNILLFDYVDDKPILEQVIFADVLLAASISAYMDYSRRFSDMKIEYLTHHVDPRIEEKSIIKVSPKIGYFGELLNTIHSDIITDYVDFNHIDTSKKSDDWIETISNYNIHYAIRQHRGIDGSKPFLKGFTAAHLDSNIIIQDTQVDATYYLGYDYPYLINDISEDNIVKHLEYTYDSYGSKEWLDGLDRMKLVKERSSKFWVQNEFKNIIDNL